MLMYSPFFKSIFWTTMGLIYAITIAGARYWAEDLGLSMNWWKWLLIAIWYCVVSLAFAGGFTLIGEREPKAGGRFLAFMGTIALAFGVCLWFVVF
jgi:hypothetical protein